MDLSVRGASLLFCKQKKMASYTQIKGNEGVKKPAQPLFEIQQF